MILGAPGVGKTYWMRQRIGELRAAGHRTDVIAKTHLACQNVGCEAVTCDHWCHRYVRNGSSSCHTLCVEEGSMVNVQIWADLAQVRFGGTAFAVAADWNQFGPICEHWCGSPVPEGLLPNSDMLYDMCGGNSYTLTENMRSDPTLFGFYTTLTDNLEADLLRAKALFPRTGRKAMFTLTMSHSRRRAINQRRNVQDKPEDAILLEAPPTTSRSGNLPQDMWIWPSLVLIGAGGPTKKGLFYTISAIDDDSVTFTCGLRLSRENAVKYCRLSYAITVQSAQGLTLKGVVRIESDSVHFGRKHLYVGVSRGTGADLVEVV